MKEKITKLESILKKQRETLKKLNLVLNELDSNIEDMEELSNFYFSKDYFNEMEKENKDNIYKDISCEILTEDAISDLMIENYDTSIKMIEIATKYLKKN